MKHICDCGQVYQSTAAVESCQISNHSAAAGNELADALSFCRDMGINPYSNEEEEE